VDADEAQENLQDLDDHSKSFIRRDEFYEYVGGYDSRRKNRAVCARDSHCDNDPITFESETGEKVVGNFLGRQIAGFNADPQNLPLAAAVREPQTWAMLAAGLLAIGGLRRRRRDQAGRPLTAASRCAGPASAAAPTSAGSAAAAHRWRWCRPRGRPGR